MAYPVDLLGADDASGLADMLHQYLAQNLSGSPAKVRQARRLRGAVLYRAAEDPAVRVRIGFHGDRIELADHPGELAGAPSITADFLSTAHLTTGEAGPFALVLRRKVRVSFSPGQIPFLLGVLRFMRLPREAAEARGPDGSPEPGAGAARAGPAPGWRRWVLVGAVAVLIAVVWLIWRWA